MPIQVLMPALSPTMEKGNLAKWHKKEGDAVKSGDVIAEIETDKATMEVEAVDEGTLGKILVPEGTNDVAVNTPIAMILGEGEDASALTDGGAALQQKAPVAAPPAKAEQSAPQVNRAPVPAKAEAAAPAPAPTPAEPDLPEGTEMVTMTVREALRDAMAEEMRRDKTVFVMGEEVAEYQGAYKVTQGLLQERVAAQHSQDYTSWYSHVPGLKVIAPHTAADAKGLLKSAIRDPNPVIFLENEILYGQSFPVPKLDDHLVPIGKAKIARPGTDVTIVAWSMGMTYALKAADELAKDKISAEVIDLRTLKPMDTATIVASVKKTGRIVTVEEGWRQSGVGAEIAASVTEHAFDWLDAPVTRVN